MSATLHPGDQVDRYTVIRPLGEGGMAAVFLVQHNTLKSFHAFKVLTQAGGRIRDRLIQEGQVQASLRHRNIVAVTDVLEVGSDIGLLMEYVEGPTLEDWLRDTPPDLDQALSVFQGILGGVGRAHRAGVIHRDLKPANVLMATDEGRLIPRVADFGLAKAMDEGGGLGQTRTGMTMGTPSYMPPEQIRDAKSVDERGDVFALGAILYELVCGRLAFPGSDLLEIFNAVASGKYVRPGELVPGLPEQVSLAIRGALWVDREDRIPDCETLSQVLAGEKLWSPVKQFIDGTAKAPQAGATYYPGNEGAALFGGDLPGAGPAGGGLGVVPAEAPAPRQRQRSIRNDLSLETLVDPQHAPAPSAPTLRPVGHTDLANVRSATPGAPPASPRGAGARKDRRMVWSVALGVCLLGAGVLAAVVLSPAEEEAAPTVEMAPPVVGAAVPGPLGTVGSPELDELQLETEVEAASPDQATRSVQPTPAVEPTVAPEVVTPDPVVSPGAEDDSPPTPAPEPVKKSEPEKKPEPEARRRNATARVRFSGADAVRLVGPRGTFPAGDVPPGKYTVEATFGEATVNAATLYIRADESWDLNCDPDFTICRAKKR